MSSEPALPHASTCPPCSARRSARAFSGVPDHRCEPGTKRVCSVVGAKLIDHQDEAEERPVGGVARDVHVQFLGWRARPQRPRGERTELERSADDAVARFQQRWKYIEVVELGTTIYEIIHLR